MNCDQCQAEISRMMDGEGSGAVLAGVFRHLAECEVCRRFYVSVHAVQRTPAVPEAYPLRIDRVVRARLRERPAVRMPAFAGWWSGFLGWRIRVPAPAVVAVAAIMLLAGLYVVRGSGGYSPAAASVVFVPTLPEVAVEGEIAPTSPE